LLSDIMPTAYFAADMAHVKPARTVAVLGCGPVGQMAIASAKLMDAGRIIAIDAEPDRLDVARRQGAEAVDFSTEDPVEAIKQLTGGIGVDCVMDCVGIDADKDRHSKEQWKAGTAPETPLEWAVDIVAKAGTVSVVGVYPAGFKGFDFGKAFGKNLTIRMGDCPHRRYLPRLIRLVASGALRPSRILTNVASFAEAIDAYKAFDLHSQGWLKVELLPDRRPSATKGELVTA
jgi:threonine dehydrogenase-like Zn-dependent dehydrogenase